MTSRKVTYLYDLMDAAYDAKRIDETSRQLGHVTITERNGRGQEAIPMAPHEAEHYKIRSGVTHSHFPALLMQGRGEMAMDNSPAVLELEKWTIHLLQNRTILFVDNRDNESAEP